MASNIDRFVNVNIEAANTNVPQSNFNKPLLYGQVTAFGENAREYTSVQALLDDGFDTNDPIVQAARALYAQSQFDAVNAFVVGKANPSVAQPPSYTLKSKFDPTVTGADPQLTFYPGAVAIPIAAGLTPTQAHEAIITAASAAYTAAYPGESLTTNTGGGTIGDYALLTGVLGKNFWFEYDRAYLDVEKVQVGAGTYDLATDLINIRNENDSWYALLPVDAPWYAADGTLVNILDMAAAIEPLKKLMIVNASGPREVQSTGGFLGTLNTLSRKRTATIIHNYTHLMQHAGWTGRRLPLTPGTETWHGVSIAGVPAVDLTPTEIDIVQSVKATAYITVGGSARTLGGFVSDGGFIDSVRYIDSLESRIQTSIVQTAVNLPKIPYLASGIAVVQNAISTVLVTDLGLGILEDNSADAVDPNPIVLVPDISTIPQADKVARVLNNVTFKAVYSNALHSVQINGRLLS